MDLAQPFLDNPKARQATEALFLHLTARTIAQLGSDITTLRRRAISEDDAGSADAEYWYWVLEVVIDYRNGRLAEERQESPS